MEYLTTVRIGCSYNCKWCSRTGNLQNLAGLQQLMLNKLDWSVAIYGTLVAHIPGPWANVTFAIITIIVCSFLLNGPGFREHS